MQRRVRRRRDLHRIRTREREKQRQAQENQEAQKEELGKGAALPESEKKSGFKQEVLFLLLKVMTIAVMFLLVFTFLFGISRNTDASMDPSIKDGDLVIFDRLDQTYIKSDVLVLKFQGQVQARRVIAVAGDVVDITEDGLMINGSLQQERGITEKTFRYDTGVQFPMTIPEGEVFVLGDAREHSTDSRVYGSIKVKDTLGKVMTIIRRRGI